MFDYVQSWVSPARSRAEAERRFRVLVPIAGGPNALAALGVLPGLAKPENEIVFLHVRRPGAAPASALLERAREAVAGLPHVETREVVAFDFFEAIVEESRGHDLLVLGASEDGWPFGPALLSVVKRSECPAIVVRRETGSRRVSRDGPRALVVAESSPFGMLGLERALRWARAGSVAQEILLTPAPRHLREIDPDRRRLDLRQYGGSAVRVARRALGSREVLEEIDKEPRDLVVLACDPHDIESGDAWTDEVAARTACAVVCVFASRTGPRTRRHRVAVEA